MRTREREPRAGRRSVWPALGLAAAVVAVLYFAGWGITGARYSGRLARLKAQGEPVAPSDLIPRLKPGERNAADLYEQALALMPRQGLERLCANGTWQWNVPDLPLARAIVNGSPRFYELLEEASRIPTCSFPIRWDERGNWQFDQNGDFSWAVQALLVKAQLKAHDGDLDGALASYATALRIAGHLEQLPDGRILASSADRVVLNEAIGVLSLGDPSPAACRRLADQLASSDYRALLVRAVKAQRVAGLARMRWMEQGHWFVQSPPRSARWVVREAYPVVAKPLWYADKERYLEVMAAYVEAAKRPWPEAGKEVKRLDDQVKRLFPPQASPMAWIAPSGGIFRFTGRDAAMTGAWQVALALRAYHHDHGTYPATLVEVEKTGWKLPEDPFARRPYRYRRDGTGFIVWSVGFDLKDNGARPFPFDDWEVFLSPGYDFVLQCER